MDTPTLLALRPTVETAPGALPAEAFQNVTLRPLLKLLHPRLVDAWHRYAERQKGTFYRLNRPEQETYLRHALRTNRELRSFYLGLVCAMMTPEEWGAFRQNERELSRRLLSMTLQRLEGDDTTYRQPTLHQ